MLEKLLAVSVKTGDGKSINVDNVPTNSADSVLNGVLGTVYWVAGIVAVLVIIVAGIYYTTSNGNPAQVSRAKNAIIAGLTGLVLVVMAFTLTQFIVGAF